MKYYINITCTFINTIFYIVTHLAFCLKKNLALQKKNIDTQSREKNCNVHFSKENCLANELEIVTSNSCKM